MPGYHLRGADEGVGLLPWAWAERRLVRSRSYWLATTREDGRPHVMPIWGVWDRDALWFSTGIWSRKARNLYLESRCTLTTEDPTSPVIVEGIAELVTEPSVIEHFVSVLNAKYDTELEANLEDPVTLATVRVRPQTAFGMSQRNFTGSATRWRFDVP